MVKKKRKKRKTKSYWDPVDKDTKKRFKKGYDPWKAAGYRK